jgi:hypothetical protein
LHTVGDKKKIERGRGKKAAWKRETRMKGTSPAPVGISPSTWGPTVWALAHTFAELADRLGGLKEAASFFKALRSNLPCRVCREAYDRHTGTLTLGTSAVEYASALHAAVNVDLGKAPYFGRDTSVAIRRVQTARLVRVLGMAMRRSVEFFDACIREREYFDDAETHAALADRLALSVAVSALKKKARAA